MIRLFAAIPVADGAKRELAGLLAELRRSDWPVRWVPDDALHVTLKFFGELDEPREAQLAAMLEAAVQGTLPIPLRLAGLGTLPAGRRARVVCANLEAPPALELLQDRIERGSDAEGFPPEGRPFRPHVTLGRVHRGVSLAAAARARCRQETLDEPFLADRVVLYQSRLLPGGSEYIARRTFDLGV